MDGPVRVGDKITLPSGASFVVTASGVETIPWKAVEVGDCWAVCRPYLTGGGTIQFFYGGKREPALLDHAEAVALAETLNAALPL